MENIVIIGAGPAGISAALYAARGNMNPLVINNGIGALEKAEKIENYYGLEQPLSGKELYERGIAQAKALGVRILDAEVLGISGFDTFTVKTTAGDFDTVSAPGTANDDTLLYGVEVKFYNMEVEIDDNLESCHKGLYVIGDGSGVTHSLSHASASGIYVARHIVEQN